MRLNIFLAFGLSLLILLSCTKENDIPNQDTENEVRKHDSEDEVSRHAEEVIGVDSTILAGTWELRYSIGGMRPTNPNYLPGNGIIVRFKGNRFERLKGREIFQSANFTIKDSVVRVNQTTSTHFFKYGNDIHEQRFLRLANGKLVEFIGQIAADGGEMTYVKIEDGQTQQ